MQQPIPDFSPLRQKFSALQQKDEQGNPYIYFDGPGGTQVPQMVIDSMVNYLTHANANEGGHFITSRRNSKIIAQARLAMADFLNAPSPQEIVFGPNMTTLTFNFSRSIAALLESGDEIIVTHLDHDANISPWLSLVEKGIKIKWVPFDTTDCRLEIEQLTELLSPRTKLVAVGYASNAVGTINPIKQIADIVHEVGAWLWVDAVHYAPHGPIDVQNLDCDFLVCSAYKFFGPHIGIVWGRYDLLETLPAYKVRPAKSTPPHKFETGTLNHEGLAGVAAAIDYLTQIGQEYGAEFASEFAAYKDRRRLLKQAMHAIALYERNLFTYLMSEIEKIPGIKVYGITDPEQFSERCPTLAFTHTDFTPEQIASYLGQQNIFVWDGNYYALSVTERLGVEESGGMVRVGLTHYNTKEEVDRFLTALRHIKVR